jgi:hypothetical protein
MTASAHAKTIFDAATPVLRIDRVGGAQWVRNVAKGSRIGPWLQGSYKVLDERAWHAKGPCLYLVGGSDSVLRYAGISRNGLRHRWRQSPAFDALSGIQLPERQLFHSQCWKHIERESSAIPNISFEVRSIEPVPLAMALDRIGPPLSGFALLRDDGEGLVASIERWLCNQQSDNLVTWNKSMTRKR